MLARASSLVFDIPSTLFSQTFHRSTVPYLLPLREAAQKWMLDLASVIIFIALADLISIRVSCLVFPCDTREHKETVFGKHLRYQHLVSQHEALVDSVRIHFGHMSSFMDYSDLLRGASLSSGPEPEGIMLSPTCFTGSIKQLAAVGYFSNCLPP